MTFHLAGINNQNFLMRDDQTGTFWQQISGRAVSGPLAGTALQLIHSDELTLKLWKGEQPDGTVLKDVAGYSAEYAPENWDVSMKRTPTVLSYAQPGLAPRDLMIGIHAGGAARAFPYETALKQKLIEDNTGTEVLMVVTGPDNESVRAFSRRLPDNGAVADFYRISGADASALIMDGATGSKWNFQGCATAGPETGHCLRPIDAIKDYWFDWRQYNPGTTVFGLHAK